jgi:hypothetical protein
MLDPLFWNVSREESPSCPPDSKYLLPKSAHEQFRLVHYVQIRSSSARRLQTKPGKMLVTLEHFLGIFLWLEQKKSALLSYSYASNE